MNRFCVAILVAIAAWLVSACSGGGSGPPQIISKPETLRISGGRTADEDALAASLLQSTGFALSGPGRPAFAMANGELEQALVFMVRAHLEANALGRGAGANLAGAARNRRLATLPGAPKDRNGNGTALDEVLAEDLAMLAERAGASPLDGALDLLFPWREGRADFVTKAVANDRAAHGEHRTMEGPREAFDIEQVGHAMLARVLAASRWLRDSRGRYVGATAADGQMGILLMQQAVAMEETLLASLFHDGDGLRRLKDPKGYDPSKEARWLPSAFRITEERQIKGAPLLYFPQDRAASLSGLTAVLRAATELAWVASAKNPHSDLRSILNGSPFGPLPPSHPSIANNGAGAISFTEDVRPILAQRCAGCHSHPQPSSGFDATSYEAVLKGGNLAADPKNPRSVVKGDHGKSLLWMCLNGDTPLPGRPSFDLPRMPPVPQSRLSSGEISIIAGWIDGGAIKDPPAKQEPPSIGIDLARVLVRNISSRHVHAKSKLLHDRHEGDRPSEFASAGSTGDTLLALSAFTRVADGQEAQDARQLLSELALAASRFVDNSGQVYSSVEIANELRSDLLADLDGQARMVAGMAAAARLLGDSRISQLAQSTAAQLVDGYFDSGNNLFRTDLRRKGRRYTPGVLAVVLEALREASDVAVLPKAVEIHDLFLGQLRSKLVYSEWDGRGELIGDGKPDTDQNGIPEPSLAGGPNGRAPVFVGEILHGPAPEDEPLVGKVTWSKHVQPLFRAACAHCHMDGNQRGGYRIDTPSLLAVSGDPNSKRPLVVPGDPQGSYLYRKLVDRRPAAGEQMPIGLPPLGAAGTTLVRQWILEGARSR